MKLLCGGLDTIIWRTENQLRSGVYGSMLITRVLYRLWSYVGTEWLVFQRHDKGIPCVVCVFLSWLQRDVANNEVQQLTEQVSYVCACVYSFTLKWQKVCDSSSIKHEHVKIRTQHIPRQLLVSMKNMKLLCGGLDTTIMKDWEPATE